MSLPEMAAPPPLTDLYDPSSSLKRRVGGPVDRSPNVSEFLNQAFAHGLRTWSGFPAVDNPTQNVPGTNPIWTSHHVFKRSPFLTESGIQSQFDRQEDLGDDDDERLWRHWYPQTWMTCVIPKSQTTHAGADQVAGACKRTPSRCRF